MEYKVGDIVRYTDAYLSGFGSYIRKSRFIMTITALPKEDGLYICETKRGLPLFVQHDHMQPVYQLEFEWN